MVRFCLIFIGVFVMLFTSFGQVEYDKTNFRSPLGIDLVLAGNFAEMRTNHFHTGIDIKTNGREGYKIYAVDSGYISRINISHYGYGNALYITHPNGYTSVYAHLSTFPDNLLNYIRKKQFSNESEIIQVYPGESELRVNKGDVVAYSGNSGSSSAPHLHFEIRESGSERPVNPLLFHLDIKDDKKPTLLDIKVYPLEGGYVNGKKEPFNIDLKGADGAYQREYDTPVFFKGKIGLAINAIDYLNGASNKCGIYSVDLFVDEMLFFSQKLDKLDFSTNRYINTHQDYLEYRLRKQSYHKSFVAENNKLDIYEGVKNEGRIVFDDTLKHVFKYVVKDVYGNTSEVAFEMKSQGLSGEENEVLSGPNLLDASSKNEVHEEGFEAILPRNTLYEDLKYEYSQIEAKGVAPIHKFHNDYIPVQQYFVLKVKTSGVPKGKEDKALIVEMSSNNKIAYAKGGSFEDGWVSSEVKSFGNYSVRLDTVAPQVTAVNISDGKDLSGSTFIQFKIADNLSGVDDYDMYVDGKWKLSFYDTKKGTLTLPFEAYNDIKAGEHELKVVVKDERKNTTQLTYKFIR